MKITEELLQQMREMLNINPQMTVSEFARTISAH